MDIDEDELRRGAISPRLFGYAKVPYIPLLLQNAKVRNHGLDEAALDAAARQIAARDGDGRRSMRSAPAVPPSASSDAMNLSGSLLGTDLVLGGKLVARDANERTILDLAKDRKLRIIVGVIGGQGHVFGRGNQELSPAVIRLAGRDGDHHHRQRAEAAGARGQAPAGRYRRSRRSIANSPAIGASWSARRRTW